MLRFGSNNGNIRPFNKVWWCSCFFEKLAFDIKYSTASSFSYSSKISFVHIYIGMDLISHIILKPLIVSRNQSKLSVSKMFDYKKVHLKLTVRSNLFISLADFPKNHNLRLHFHIFKKFSLGFRIGWDTYLVCLKCTR